MPAVRKAMKAYVDERVRNTAIVTDADELPEGVVARVGQLSVTDADVREAVLEQVSDEQRREAREFLVDRALLRHMLGAKKLLPLTPDDRALQEDFVRYQLQKDRTWRRADVTLDAFLQNTRGMGLEAFRRTRDFRLNVMLTKIAAAQVTDSMLRQLYEADPHRYGDDQRRARVIRLYAFPELAARPTTAEQHQRMKQRRAEIDRQLGAGKDFAAQFARAEARAREILQKLNGEVRFETLAAVYNDDPDLARVRGDLGFVARDAKDLDPALVEAIYSTPVGQRSDVVRGRYGYFIVKTVAERDVSFEDARKALRFAAIAEQRRHVLEALRRQRAEAVTNLRKDEAESGAP
jgi:hypothetical protein